jgi:hypothetical protein
MRFSREWRFSLLNLYPPRESGRMDERRRVAAREKAGRRRSIPGEPPFSQDTRKARASLLFPLRRRTASPYSRITVFSPYGLFVAGARRRISTYVHAAFSNAGRGERPVARRGFMHRQA